MKRLYIILMIMMCVSYPVFAHDGGYIIQADINDERLVFAEDKYSLAPSFGIYYAASEEDLNSFCESYDVISYEEDERVELFDVPDDAGYANRWDAPLFDLPYLWDYDISLEGVKVGIIDTGISSDHEDFDYSRIYRRVNLCAERELVLAEEDLTTEENIEKLANVEDDIGHGTSVAGIIGSMRGNGKGAFGIADGVDLYIYKAFSSNCDYVSCIVGALYKCLEDEVDVINMSLGAPSSKDSFQKIVDELYARGTVIVSAVGNKGETTMYYPAGCEHVIGVGSIGKSLERSSFSQHNTSVFVSAPGESMYTPSLNNSYKYMMGTSFSSPFTAAVAAYAKAVDKSINADGFKNLLRQTSLDMGDEGYDEYYGWGVIQPARIADVLGEKYELMYKTPSAVVKVNTPDKESEKTVLSVRRNLRRFSVIVPIYSGGVLDRTYIYEIFPGSGAVEFEVPLFSGEVLLWNDEMRPLAPFDKILQ